jgi:hypothetical protein
MLDLSFLDGRRGQTAVITGYHNGKFLVRGRSPIGLSKLLNPHKERLIALLAGQTVLFACWDTHDPEAIVYALPVDGSRDKVEQLVLPFWRGKRQQPSDVAAIIMAAGGCSAIAERLVSRKTGKAMTRQAVSMWNQIPEEHCRLIAQMSGYSAREVWFAGKGKARFDIFTIVETADPQPVEEGTP